MDLLSLMKNQSTRPVDEGPHNHLPSTSPAPAPPSTGAEGRGLNVDKSVPPIEKAQREWRPPPQVEPDLEAEGAEGGSEEEVTHLGEIATDAALFMLKEKIDGEVKEHYVLRMPSALPKANSIPENSDHIFNLLMADVSSSMSKYWNSVQSGWNSHVAPRLLGRSVIYTFGSSVIFRRGGTELESHDFDGGGTDLTGALQTIINEVYQCREKYVNIFIISDGDHTATDVKPSAVIDRMQSPESKVCNVFILGIGDDFPVQYSVDIRSRLHNGSCNIPSLFFAKEMEDITDDMSDISKKIYNGNSCLAKLNLGGSVLPCSLTKTSFHLNEWVYLPHKLEELKDLSISFANHIGLLFLEPQEVDIETFEEINKQWSSVIIQRHRNGEKVPAVILDLKQRFIYTQMMEIMEKGDNSIKGRLQKKNIRMKLKKQLGQLNRVLSSEIFGDKLQFTESILSTTVGRNKYKNKSLQQNTYRNKDLQLKSHTDNDYDLDRIIFLQILEQNISEIHKILMTPNDCCHITMTSTVTDLQDVYFVEFLNESDKFTFLNNFAITGIPVLVPTDDSVVINPWTYKISKMLRHPYTILNNNAIDLFTDMQNVLDSDLAKLKCDDKSFTYNAVVPVFPPTVAKIMKPIVDTSLYAMCVTFSTTKNSNIVDDEIHMASLAVAWVYCLYENPSQPRAEYVRLRMESIEATAALYMDRSSYTNYCKILVEDTPQALMWKSTIQVENKVLKCESLVKPIFFLHMMKSHLQQSVSLNMKQAVQLILMEYVGRCISNYREDFRSKAFCEFFAESLDNQEKRKIYIDSYLSEKREELFGKDSLLLEKYYTLKEVSEAAKKIADSQGNTLIEDYLTKLPIKVNISTVEKLKDESSTGDISWSILRAFASEIGLENAEVIELFSEESLFLYTFHALRYRTSRGRLSNPLENFTVSHTFVFEKVQEESDYDFSKMFYTELRDYIERSWLNAYFEVHNETVKPMTRQQVISEAKKRGIEVSEENFDQVYKRFRPTGLLSNACQTRACPHFLQPSKIYNLHASVERTKGGVFVHGLHKAVQRHRNYNIETLLNTVASGSCTISGEHILESEVRKLTSEIQRLKILYMEIG